jgi:hypothetical protein
MFSIDVSALAKLAEALLHGDDNIISKLIEDKVEDLGRDMLANLLPANPLQRVSRAIETGGKSELNRIRGQWLSSVTPAPLPGQGMFNRITNAFEKNKQLLTRPEGKWQKWSRSRQAWLDESYRHNWRTQPRDARGRWKVGRLRYPYVPKTVRRLNRAAKRAGRTVARQAIRGVTQPGNWRSNRKNWLDGN